MRKSFATFVKEDSKYTTRWLVNKRQIQPIRFVKKAPYRLTKKQI